MFSSCNSKATFMRQYLCAIIKWTILSPFGTWSTIGCKYFSPLCSSRMFSGGLLLITECWAWSFSVWGGGVATDPEAQMVPLAAGPSRWWNRASWSGRTKPRATRTTCSRCSRWTEHIYTQTPPTQRAENAFLQRGRRGGGGRRERTCPNLRREEGVLYIYLFI